MAEIPEYLLERSRERRKLLTGQDPGPAATAEATETAAPGDGATGGAAPAGAAPATTAPAPGDAAPAAPPATAPVPTPAPTPAPPPPTLPWVKAAMSRKRIPFWVMPVLLFLPLWGFLYVGTLEAPDRGETGLLGEGHEVYAEVAACSSCHGASGEGLSSGPQLNGGELMLTFPDDPQGLGLAQQLAWVTQGTNATGVGRPYGDPQRGRVAGWFGEMSSFGDSLSAHELLAVVFYERAVHGESETARTWAGLAEELLESGELVLPESLPLDITVGQIQELLAPIFAHDQEAQTQDG